MQSRQSAMWAVAVGILMVSGGVSRCAFEVTYPAEDAFLGDQATQDVQGTDHRADTGPDDSVTDSKDDSTLPDAKDLLPDDLASDADDAVQDVPEDGVGPDVEPGECQTDADCILFHPTAKNCFMWVCTGSPRTCVEKPADAVNCDDGNLCTDNDACLDGQCVGLDKICPEEPCKDALCDPAQGCYYKPLTDVPCDDGDVCSDDSACVDGLCTGLNWAVCADSDPCTSDWCDPIVGCQSLTVPGCGICYEETQTYNADFGGECCTGLQAVPLCEIPVDLCPSLNCPDACSCDGVQVICTRCGDGACGAGENVCNCLQDCPAPTQTCSSVEGLCTDGACSTGYHLVQVSGCPSMQNCCVKDPDCTPLWGTGTFEGEYSCCSGVPIALDTGSTASENCQISGNEFICASCGNGVCDQPYETPCNCGDCQACIGFVDCPFFKGCVDGVCKECGYELCNTALNEDCDLSQDETICAPKLCSNPPGNFEPVPLWAVLKNPAFFDSKYIAVVGRVVVGDTACAGLACTAQLFVEEEINAKRLLLAPSANYPVVSCSAQLLNLNDPFDPVDCTPLTPPQVYVVHGRLIDTGGVPKLFLLGFCQ